MEYLPRWKVTENRNQRDLGARPKQPLFVVPGLIHHNDNHLIQKVP